MELHIAIRKIIDIQGKGFIANSRLVNALSDYRAFDDNPAEKNVLRILLQEGYAQQLLNCGSWTYQAQKLWYDIERKYCIKGDIAKHIIECLAYGLGYIRSINNSSTNNSKHEVITAPQPIVNNTKVDSSQKISQTIHYDYKLIKGDILYSSSGADTIEKEQYAFDDTLTKVVIPEGVRHIKFGAFRDCSNLEMVSFPSSLEDIGPMCFNNCKKLRHVEFRGLRVPNISEDFIDKEWKNVEFYVDGNVNNDYFDYLFKLKCGNVALIYGCKIINLFPVDFANIPIDVFLDVKSVCEIPLDGNKVLKIRQQYVDRSYFYQYRQRADFPTVIFEEGTEYIAAGTVYANLSWGNSRIIFPKSIKEIGTLALNNTHYLTGVRKFILEFRNPTPPIIKHPIFGNAVCEHICIPKGSYDLYSKINWCTDSGWSRYIKFEEFDMF